MFRLLRVYLKGKRNLFNKISHKRYMELLSKANSVFDGCYTLKEIQYLSSKY
jgi:hypothetical protein